MDLNLRSIIHNLLSLKYQQNMLIFSSFFIYLYLFLSLCRCNTQISPLEDQ